MKGKRVYVLKAVLSALLALLLVLALAACSKSNNDSDSAGSLEDRSMAEASSASMEPGAPGGEANFTVSDQAAAPAAQEAEAMEKPAASALANEGGAGSEGFGGIGQIADANAGFGRKVIYTASIVMKVEKFTSAKEQLTNLIHQSGAYVLQFNDSRDADEKGASYVIKVPSERFSDFLDSVSKIKNLDMDQNVSGSDVTEEFVDLESRLKAKQTVESRLLAFMDKATRSDDLVRFSNELANVQEQIEQIKGRMRYLQQNVEFSTINLRLYQSDVEETPIVEEPEEKDFGDRIADALGGSAKVLRQFGEGILIVLAALLPVLIVVGVVGIPAFLLLRNRRIARKAQSEEKRKAWNATAVNPEEITSPEDDPNDKRNDQET